VLAFELIHIKFTIGKILCKAAIPHLALRKSFIFKKGVLLIAFVLQDSTGPAAARMKIGDARPEVS